MDLKRLNPHLPAFERLGGVNGALSLVPLSVLRHITERMGLTTPEPTDPPTPAELPDWQRSYSIASGKPSWTRDGLRWPGK